ncbi:ROK family protein [Nocardiopsis dassonvillei]|uniref:ROK family protein n=1 Tax=Nocardiopsis dassonvillei TaxID=2014 RepID=UPI00102C8F2E|nr:ROK family protein [Nocardiopsis dassonvillei]MCP3012713.1 ROK family protein [Nocardiopsis dassonvillei]
MSAVVAVDVGGTLTKAALVDADHRVLLTRRTPTPTGSRVAEAVIDTAAALVGELRSASRDAPVAAVGAVVPGIVDVGRGVAVWSENLLWRDVPVRDRLAERCGLPVALGHDVAAGGLAEQRLGAARGHEDAVFVPIGTGLSAALLLGGRAHTADGFAGEMGHVDVGHGGPCACGATGCLEAIASAAAIARRYAERTGRPTREAREVADLLVRGDPDARRVWDEAVDALALGLSWISAVLAPRVIVVGGGLARSGELLLAPLRERLEARLTFHRRPDVVPAALGDEAGCLGAALLARELLERP